MSREQSGTEPSSTVQGEGPIYPLRQWLLLDASRLAITAGLTACYFLALMAVGVADLSLRRLLSQGDNVETLFQTLITVLVTGVTLVISINQLVLSQEFGAIGRQRERMDKSMTFRQDAEHEFGWIGPPEPDRFLQTLVDASESRASALADAVSGNPDRELCNRVSQFTERIERSATDVADGLEQAEFGEFTVMKAALAYNYSWKIYVARRLRWEHEESLDDDERSAFDDLVGALELFGPAEEFFKAHYLQWELVNLSRQILYTGIPGLFVAVVAALYLKPAVVSGQLFGIDVLVWAVNAGVTVTLIPFFVFTAYVLRIATIAKETGALGPFVLHESERAPLITWDE